jgi:hypothetical protein
MAAFYPWLKTVNKYLTKFVCVCCPGAEDMVFCSQLIADVMQVPVRFALVAVSTMGNCVCLSQVFWWLRRASDWWTLAFAQGMYSHLTLSARTKRVMGTTQKESYGAISMLVRRGWIASGIADQSSSAHWARSTCPSTGFPKMNKTLIPLKVDRRPGNSKGGVASSYSSDVKAECMAMTHDECQAYALNKWSHFLDETRVQSKRQYAAQHSQSAIAELEAQKLKHQKAQQNPLHVCMECLCPQALCQFWWIPALQPATALVALPKPA